MEFLDRAYAQLRNLYGSSAPGGRLTAALLTAVALLSLGYFGTRQLASPRVDLMRGVALSAAQLPAIEAAFAKANLTGYEIRGTSIYVPQGQEAAYMAAMVKENVQPKNFGAHLTEAVSGGSIIETTAQRELRMKVAIQNELSLQISKMPGIEQADVIYNEDKPAGFQEKAVKAIVSVKPVGAMQLDESRVMDIRHHVAGAIAGLKPEDVTVSDLNGPTWYGNVRPQNANASSRAQLATVTAPAVVEQNHPTEAMKPEVASETPPDDMAQAAWRRLSGPWAAPALIALALACLLFLSRSIFRGKPGAAARAALAEDAEAVVAASGKVPPPHWRRQPQPEETSLQNELSQFVRDDPDAAANILRNWIGQVN